MSNSHDDAGPRPQVIDLEAEEIRTETGASPADDETPRAEQAYTPPPPPPKKRGGSATWLIAALVLGAIGGGWLYRGVLSSYLPSNEMTALRNQVAALEQNNTDLANQLAAVKDGADGAAQAAADAGAAAKQAADMARAAATQANDMAGRLDEAASQESSQQQALAKAQSDLEALRKSLSAAPAAAGDASGAAPTAADAAALAALGQRIDALEKDVASLKAAGASSAQAGTTAALSQALSDLKAKVAAGTSFQPEYERIARMVPAAPGLDVVAAAAAQGIPDARGLAAELTAAIPALPQPQAPAAEDDSYFGAVMKSLSGIISIRPIGDTDWRELAAKAAAFAEAGDLTQAIATIDAGEGEKPMALSQWRARAEARLGLEAAVSAVSEAVLRQIAASGGAAQ